MTSNRQDWNRRHEFYSSPTGFGALTISKTTQGGLNGTASRLATTRTAAGLAATGTSARFNDTRTARRDRLSRSNARLNNARTTARWDGFAGTTDTQDGFAGTTARLNNAGTTARWDGFAGTSQAMVITPMTTTPMIVKIALIDVRRIPGTTTPDMVAVTISPIMRYSFIPGWGITIIRPSVIMVFGTIPTTAPGSPPPTTLEKQFYRNVRNRIYIGSGQNNHIRWRNK
jgi:hypothetical protein